MKIFVFGNPDLKEDSLPLRILPQLKNEFLSSSQQIEFEIKDPNEEWIIKENEELIVIDTVMGIKDVKIFNNLNKFKPAPRVGIHDFDALANLKYLQKLGKIKKIKIIGVPPDLDEKETIKKIGAALRQRLHID